MSMRNYTVSEDGPAKFAWLQKDKTIICRMKYTKFPFEVPEIWEIINIKPSNKYRELNLPHFQLLPAPASLREKNEWIDFMDYMSTRKKVGIVEMKCCSLYLLPPDECQKFTHLNVFYKINKELCVEEILEENYNKAKNSRDDSELTFNIVGRDLAADDGSPVPLRPEGWKSLNKVGRDFVSLRTESGPKRKSFEIVGRDFATADGSPVSPRMESNPKRKSFERVGSDFAGLAVSSRMESGPGRKSFDKVGRGISTDDGSPASLRMESGHERTARIHPSYLKTLSQTHVWAFGALAELIDNSRDARAAGLAMSVEHLYSRKVEERIPVLSVIDDGTGMSHSDIVRMLTFGHKSDNQDQDRIGCFGVGFKTGAMKLGKDALVLTQTTGSRSVALLSQSYNEHKENVEIPIITYRRIGSFMEIDLNIHSEKCATTNLDAIKEFSPFNEYLLGDKLSLFGETGTGTQIYIWNLEKWGSNYSLEWVDSKNVVDSSLHHDDGGDILIRSRKIRSRAGQISQKVPLDYSLQAYLEVIFLDPRMKMTVQGSMVKSRPLAKSLNKTCTVKGTIMGKEILLTLGRSRLEWERMNGGIFLFWHGRLIEAYKRVGGMMHNADIGRGVIGVIDVSDLMGDGNGVLVLNNKQGFQDCEVYAKLEEWLGNKLDKYWDKYFDRVDLNTGRVDLNTGIKIYKPDHEWVQCDKCRKWRILDASFSSDRLPSEWFCYMPPFNGNCEIPEQQVAQGIVTIGTKRSGRNTQLDQIKEKLTSVPGKKNHCEQDRLVKVDKTPSEAIII